MRGGKNFLATCQFLKYSGRHHKKKKKTEINNNNDL